MPGIGFRQSRAAALAVLLCGFSAIGAQSYIPVTIAVTDPGGAALAGAEVRVSPGAPSGDRFVADEQGRVAVGLIPGEYRLQISAQGFLPAEQKVVVQAKPQTLTVALQAPPSAGRQEGSMPMMPGAVPMDMPAERSGTAPKPANLLTITAGPGERGVFTPATLKEYPQQSVTIFDHHTNKNETYAGVPLMDLLAHLGVPHGKDLMGKVLADYVVATGSDGYKSVVALGEVDPEFHPGTVLIADTMDGKPLDAKAGPFRLIVTEDKRPARSVRNLVSIEVRSAE